jgi:hypothetical protein
MSMVGMGQLAPGPASSPSCGTNPCGFFDYIWASDACVAYNCCAAPSSTFCVATSQGALAAAAQAAGGAATGAVTEIAGGLVAGAANNIASATGLDPTTAGYLILGGFGVAAFFLIEMMVKK